MTTRTWRALWLPALLPLTLAVAQEPTPPQPAPEPPPPQEEGDEDDGPMTREELERALLGGNEQQQEMLELFATVERKLREIDDYLFEAAAGEDEFAAEGSGLSELFLETREASREVSEGIDRILELAEKMAQQQQQQQSSGGGQQQQQQGQGRSPLDDRSPESQRERERSSQQQQEELEQQGQPREQDQEEREGGQRPEDGQTDDRPAEQREGDAAPEGERGAGSQASGAGQWGELPPRMQEIFSNQVGDDLPLEYRDWIESYWRRLQRDG